MRLFNTREDVNGHTPEHVSPGNLIGKVEGGVRPKVRMVTSERHRKGGGGRSNGDVRHNGRSS